MTDQHVDETPREVRSATAARSEDRFERPRRVGRVGAHRLVARPRRFWLYLVSALVGVAVLTGVGIVLIQNIGTDVSSFLENKPEEAATVVEQVKPVIDPEATIAVLNGTPTEGLDASVAQIITDNGWGLIGFSQVAATDDVKISAVFYSDPADESAALGLANELGGVSIYQSDNYAEYGVRLIVLLGSDYAGPGLP